MTVEEDDQGLEGTVVDEGQDSDTTSEHSLADEFLSSIEDETQRMLLAPHVKGWDAQVTKRFQGIHEEYKPYKELGEPEVLSKARDLYSRVEQNPQEVFGALAQALGVDLEGYQTYQQSLQQNPAPATQETPTTQPNPYEGFPEELVTQFSRYDEQMTQLNQAIAQIAQQNSERQEAQERAKQGYELDQQLKALKAEFGDFDDQFVLLQMYNGVDPKQAVANFNNMINERVAQVQAPANNAPRVMGSGGAPPPPAKFDPGKATNKDVTDAVAALLAQQAQQGS